VRMAHDLADVALLIMATTAESEIAEGAESWADVIANARRRLDLAERTGDNAQRMAIFIAAALVASEIEGDTRRGYELAQEAGRVDAGSHHGRLHATAAILWTGYRAGFWESIQPVLEEHLEEAALEPDTPCPLVRLGIGSAGLVATHRGNPGRGRAAFAQLEAGIGRAGYSAFANRAAAGLSLELLVALGELERARTLGLEDLERSKSPWTDDVLAPLLDAAIQLDDRATMTRLIGMARDRASGLPALGSTADRAEGLLRLATGEAEGAIALLRAALAGFERFPLPFEVSRTQRRLAAALESSEPMESGALLDAATAIERELGVKRPGGQRAERADHPARDRIGRRGPGASLRR